MVKVKDFLGSILRFFFKEVLILGVSYILFIYIVYFLLEFISSLGWSEFSDVISGITATVAPVFFYMFPTAIAYSVRHPKRETILTINIFLGFVPMVWLSLLIWSFTNGRNNKYPKNFSG